MTSAFRPHAMVRTGSLIAAAALTLALSACGQGKGEKAQSAPGDPPPAAVTVATVQAQQVQHWDSFNGRIAAQETVEIRPRVSGYIERLHFREGQLVRKGQTLFSIDDRTYKAALASAQAQLQRAQAAAALARTLDKRAQNLLVDQAISAEEADNRSGTLAQALANVSAAQAALTTAQLELGFTQVRAPITGVAGRAMLTVGNLAQADQSVLLTVVSQNPVYVYFDADEQSLLRSKQAAGKDQPSDGAVAVRIGLLSDDGFPHTGQVEFTNNRMDPQTGTIRVRASLNNDHGLFTPGMFARVQMQGRADRAAVLIDDKAVLTDQDRNYVYLVGPGKRAERRELQLGRMVGGLRMVEAGLQPGERLVVAGMQRIHYPGMPLAPTEQRDSAAPATAAAATTASASASKPAAQAGAQ